MGLDMTSNNVIFLFLNLVGCFCIFFFECVSRKQSHKNRSFGAPTEEPFSPSAGESSLERRIIDISKVALNYSRALDCVQLGPFLLCRPVNKGFPPISIIVRTTLDLNWVAQSVEGFFKFEVYLEQMKYSLWNGTELFSRLKFVFFTEWLFAALSWWSV